MEAHHERIKVSRASWTLVSLGNRTRRVLRWRAGWGRGRSLVLFPSNSEVHHHHGPFSPRWHASSLSFDAFGPFFRSKVRIRWDPPISRRSNERHDPSLWQRFSWPRPTRVGARSRHARGGGAPRAPNGPRSPNHSDLRRAELEEAKVTTNEVRRELSFKRHERQAPAGAARTLRRPGDESCSFWGGRPGWRGAFLSLDWMANRSLLLASSLA